MSALCGENWAMTRQAIFRFLEAKSARPVSPLIGATVDAILSRHGQAVAAVLFYGSALRALEDRTKALDFYVLTDNYRAFYSRRLSALGNWLLPPNVYNFETIVDGAPVRAKYAVLSLSAFERRTSRRAFESLVWGRFAQPCAIAFARDEPTRNRLIAALAEAARTMLNETLGLMRPRFHARDIWVRALQESYATELRAERTDRRLELYRHGAEHYDRIADLVFSELRPARARVMRLGAADFQHSVSFMVHRSTKLRWAGRRIVGKPLSVLRLFKAAFTFDGGLDYILWKIESHSGVSTTPTPWQRHHPLLAAPALAWRLFRRDAFR